MRLLKAVGAGIVAVLAILLVLLAFLAVYGSLLFAFQAALGCGLDEAAVSANAASGLLVVFVAAVVGAYLCQGGEK